MCGLVGPGHRPRLNSCLSFSMARSAILEFIFPRCYFPCVPGSPQQTATPTYAARLDPSCALSHRVSTFFHIWFSQNKYLNSVPLISTGKNVHTCASNIHQDGDPRKAAAKGTLPGRDPTKKAKSSKTCKKNGYVE